MFEVYLKKIQLTAEYDIEELGQDIGKFLRRGHRCNGKRSGNAGCTQRQIESRSG